MSRSRFALTAALLLLTGCQYSDLKGWEGPFSGMLIGKASDGSISKKQLSATAILDESNGSYQLTGSFGTVSVSFAKRGRIQLEASYGDLDGATLYEDDEGCFSGRTGAGNTLSVCPVANATAVAVEEIDSNGNAVFSAQFEKGIRKLGVGEGTDFTIDDAVKIAKTQSFSSRIEYEVLLQSKLQSRQAHLDLIPHLSLNSVVGLMSPMNIPNLLTGITDLVPFLFPDRWARARQAAQLAKAQKDASQMTEIETISQLEELAILQWSNARQAGMIAALNEKLGVYIEQIQVMEKFGTLPAGVSEGLKITSISMKKDLLGYDETQKSSLRNFNASLGFDRLDTIREVSIAPIRLNYAALRTYDVAEMEKVVLAKSKNLSQLDSLIAAAYQEKKASSFSWLNPAVGIGAGMFASIGIAKSKVREFQLRKASTIVQLKAQIRDLIGQWEVAKQTYRLCFQDLDQQHLRLEKVQVAYKFGKDASAMDLVTAVQETNKSELAVTNVETALQILDSRIRKLMLGKNYEDLN